MSVKICECKKEEFKEVPLIPGSLYRVIYNGVPHIILGVYNHLVSLTNPQVNWIMQNIDFQKDLRKTMPGIERLPRGTCVEYTSEV